RNDALVRGVDDAAFVLDLELVFQGVLLDEDRVGDDKAMELKALAFPVLRARHDFVDVLVVFGALSQRRPEETGECEPEYHDGDPDLDISMCHNDFREKTTSG